MQTKINKLMVFIHWATVILIILAFTSIEFRSIFGKNTLFHDVMKTSHLYIGFLVLFLTILRLVIRKFVVFPIIGQRLLYTKFRAIVAKLVHGFLYIWLITMPLLGWCIISAKGTYTIPFGLPSITPVLSKADVVKIKDIHEIFAYIGLAVIFVHATVAITEYYILRVRFKK
ncbi:MULTISPECIES: cytochrome b [Francisella]|uniref:Cytochrome B n=1 Tax=Francisella opportunistica TaxID=2016517 RepID=A0A345JP94_9GAMM|nr:MULTISPECIES: cytochrome b/b6 domain-containing protein [Francisella]APC90799.1 Cytochrome b561 [Francisella sp. MA067296]AXH29140.1 cytochrome B [Francisella opportunistica]AXH30791.1 cytochrome B [Francisella opportunistica]AXH32436.1 cytochrome B [Francisella opportunistica]